MKINFAWKMETEGVTPIEVDEAEVFAWLDDPVTGGDRAGAVGEITAQDCYDFLESGDPDQWEAAIDVERDSRLLPWSPFELDGLAKQ